MASSNGQVNGSVLENAINLKIPKNREFLGGDLLAQSLHALGVRVAFGLHGGHLDAFLTGCVEIGIRLVDTRHETVAVQAAEGLARVKGEVGVCFVTANSGFCNGLPGLATAYADRSPILCVTSSPPLRDAETNALQGFHDQVVVAKPLTKFAYRVTNVEEIPRLVAQAYRTASASPPGPVLLDFPIDVLFTPPQYENIAWGAIKHPAASLPGPEQAAIRDALELLKQAKRPCIITGTGAKGLGVSAELVKFAESLNLPVFHSMKQSASIPVKHPLRSGMAGGLALLGMKGAEHQPDLVLLLGVRTGFLLGSRSGAILPNKGCRYIQVDVDGSEIGRSHAIDLGIVSDAALALAAFNAEIAKNSVKTASSREWVQTATSLKSTRSPHEDEATTYPSADGVARMHPFHGIKAVFSALPPHGIVVMDGGEAGCWAQDVVEQHGRTATYMMSTGYLGFLGNGWGYTLGVAIANPDTPVVNLHGDGSAGFHIAELDTYARHGLRNVLTVIGNNYCWGMSKSGQELIYGDHEASRPVTQLGPGAQYHVVAEGFGCAGAMADRLEDVKSKVEELVASYKPGCLNLIISDRPIHAATRSMVGASDDKNVIVVPYYDNLPRPYYK